MASKSEKFQSAVDAWIGDSEERKAYLQANPDIFKKFFSEAVTSASFGKQGKAAKNAAEGVGLGDYLDKAYVEFRSSPEQLEKSAREQGAEEARKIIERYEAEGMADEKDVAAFRDAAGQGVEKPDDFAYDMDSAIARFQNPNIQAAIDRGTAAIERSATARGMNDGTDLRKAIADYAGQKASEDFQNAARLAEADKQTQLDAWRSKSQLDQNADTTRLDALRVLAGFGDANVGKKTGLELDSSRYVFDTTETGYQNRYEQQLAQEKDEADRKAAEDAANKKLAADVIGGVVKIFGPKA